MTGRTIGVTGASGFVGGTVARALSDAGHRVIAFGRRQVPPFEYQAYDLLSGTTPEALSGIDAVIHCAYDLSLTDVRAIAATNVRGTQILVDAARDAGSRLILVSSMSAYLGTKQTYGQAKLRSESDVLEAGGEAVRLGLVWGGAEGGMIGTLKRLARLPVVPVLGSDPYQFTVHADDMAMGFVRLVEHSHVGEPLGLAHPAPVPFERIITGLVSNRRGGFVRVPWRPVYALLRAAEFMRLSLPVRADSLLGLVQPAPDVPNSDVWAHFGVRLRAFGEPDQPFAESARAS